VLGDIEDPGERFVVYVPVAGKHILGIVAGCDGTELVNVHGVIAVAALTPDILVTLSSLRDRWDAPVGGATRTHRLSPSPTMKFAKERREPFRTLTESELRE